MYEATTASRELATWVAATWQETVTVGSHADGVHPDGSIDIVWDGSELVVFGPRTRSEAMPEARPGTSVGVRLTPGSTRAMLGETADALTDRTVPLEDLWGTAADLAAMRLASAGSDRVMSEFSAVLIERGRAGARPDRLILRVVELAGHRAGGRPLRASALPALCERGRVRPETPRARPPASEASGFGASVAGGRPRRSCGRRRLRRPGAHVP